MALVAADAAVFKGEAGFRGETGRAKHDAPLEGDWLPSLTGDRGIVRELWDLGESTVPVLVAFDGICCFVLPAAAFVRRGFLGFGMVSVTGAFSLSDVMLNSSTACVILGGCSFRAGLGAALPGLDEECCGIGGSG